MDYLFQDDLNLEARAVINDLTRAALSRGGDGGDSSSRWRTDFAGGAEAAAAAAERAAPPLENASARRRRLAPPHQQRQGANSARGGSGSAPVAHAQPTTKLPAPADPIASMAKRQEQLKAAREERKERELLQQAKALESRAAAEREARAARVASAAATEEQMQHLAAATAEARRQLDEEARAFEADLAGQMRLREQQRTHGRLNEQLSRLQRQRQALRDAAAAEAPPVLPAGRLPPRAPSTAWRSRAESEHGTAAALAAAAAAEDAVAAVEAAAVEAAKRAEAEHVRVRTLRHAAFRAWRSLLVARHRRAALARRHAAWNLRRKCWSSWVRLHQRQVSERDAARHEGALRAMHSAELVALTAYRARLLSRCFRIWFTWQGVQASLRRVQAENEGRQQRIERLLASIGTAAKPPPAPPSAVQAAEEEEEESATAARPVMPRRDGWATADATRAAPPPPTPPRPTSPAAASAAGSEAAPAPPTPPTPRPAAQAASADVPTRPGATVEATLAAKAMLGLSFRRSTPSYTPPPTPPPPLPASPASAVASPPPTAAAAPSAAAAAAAAAASDAKVIEAAVAAATSAVMRVIASPPRVGTGQVAVPALPVAAAQATETAEEVAAAAAAAVATAAAAAATATPAATAAAAIGTPSDGTVAAAAVEEAAALPDDAFVTPRLAPSVGLGGDAGARAAAVAVAEEHAQEEEEEETTPPPAAPPAAHALKPSGSKASGGRGAGATPRAMDAAYERQLQRAEERKARRSELLRKYEEQQAAAAAAAAAEAAARDAAEREARREKAAAMKAAREASDLRRQRQAMAAAKTHLAELHSQRAVLVSHGWAPWARLLAQSRLSARVAAAHRFRKLASPVFDAWGTLARRTRARLVCEHEAIVAVYAQRLRCRAEARWACRRWRDGSARSERAVQAARRHIGLGLLRRLYGGWAIQARLARDVREAEWLKMERQAVRRHERDALRDAVAAWAAWAEEARFEKRKAVCKEELWRKVHGWLGAAAASGSGGGGGVAAPSLGVDALVRRAP